jgi:hypothetical protein
VLTQTQLATEVADRAGLSKADAKTGVLATTSRYLHARPATEQAQAFTDAFATTTRQTATT